jgi:methylase of polypeptide subunit release factors
MLIMSKKPQKTDRHKALRKMVAVRGQFHEPAQYVIEREGFTDLTEFVNVAIKEKLERHNAWPWKRDDKA